MRSFLVALLALACVSETFAVVCEKDICSRVRCLEVAESACLARGKVGEYKFFEHGGFCGCCHECAKLLQVNEQCDQLIHIQGAPIHHQLCADGLKCDSVKHVCVKNVVA